MATLSLFDSFSPILTLDNKNKYLEYRPDPNLNITLYFESIVGHSYRYYAGTYRINCIWKCFLIIKLVK